MRICTYNIRLGVESNLAAVAAAVAGVDPDVLALQEVGHHWNMGEKVDQARVIADHLGLPHAYFAGALTDAEGGRYGVALAARWPIVGPRVEALPRVEDEQRVLLSAVLDAPAGPVTALVTHLSIAEGERRAQGAVIGAAAAAATGPVLVLGDLNDRPGTPTIEAARGALTDLFDAAGEGAPETFSVVDPHRRIDYLFCGGGLRPAGPCRVLREATASDHFPLVATVVRG